MQLQKLSLAALSVISVVSFSSYAAGQPPANPTDKFSYTMGADIGSNFKRQHMDVNPDMMAQGIKDALAGGKMLMEPQEMQAAMADFQKELVTKREAQMQQSGDKNKVESEAFLAANKTKPGVVTLPDGLQYKIIKAGSGVSPTDKDTVTVNYEGAFPNGQVFDSSYTRGKPISFKVNEVIPGWTEALKMMKPGAEWMLYIPASLGYGEKGAGGLIGPNQALVFKVELISVQP